MLAGSVATLNSEEESDPPTYKDAFPPLPEKAPCSESTQEPAGAWGNKIRPIKASVITQVGASGLHLSLRGGGVGVSGKGVGACREESALGCDSLSQPSPLGQLPRAQPPEAPRVPPVFGPLQSSVCSSCPGLLRRRPPREPICLVYLLSHCLEAILSFWLRCHHFSGLPTTTSRRHPAT